MLRNVHSSVPSPNKKLNVALVKGSYDYYHYLQDGEDDKGWGCAYRSLQTISSWIILNVPLEQRTISTKQLQVPSLMEIQEALVEIEDKPSSFLNSRSWIGSFEISLCLDFFFGISSKIIHCKSGTEVKEHIFQLYQHFTTKGSPVMVGGGEGAMTLLGVAFSPNHDIDDESKEQYFLLLDPHFTGQREDKEVVINGKWCSWHSDSFFQAGSFYNFCLPLV